MSDLLLLWLINPTAACVYVIVAVIVLTLHSLLNGRKRRKELLDDWSHDDGQGGE